MRRVIGVLGLVALVVGCTDRLAVRQAELAQWVGRPETDLVGLLGAPSRTYEAGGMKFLTFEDRRVETIPGSPLYYQPGPFGYGGGGIPPSTMFLTCDTTFTIAGGVVRAFSLRGNACG